MEEGAVFTTKLRKVGGSVMLTIPPAVLEMLQLHPGAAVGLSVDAGHLVVDPQARPRYSLDELLAQCDASANIAVEDRVWLDGEPVGGELL
jgi:antitoxin ChpS